MIGAALTKLAGMLGVRPELAEDALHSERAARAVLTRRNLLAAGAALASGAAFSLPVPEPEGRWVWVQMGPHHVPGVVGIVVGFARGGALRTALERGGKVLDL